MRHVVTMFGGLLALGACAAPALIEEGRPAARPPEPPPEVRLVSAIEARGCVLTADNVGEVLLAANLRQAELQEITQSLIAAGRVEAAGEGQIRVLTDRCI